MPAGTMHFIAHQPGYALLVGLIEALKLLSPSLDAFRARISLLTEHLSSKCSLTKSVQIPRITKMTMLYPLIRTQELAIRVLQFLIPGLSLVQ
jgi:hypothetical protein